MGWMLFDDGNHCLPDFWHADSVVVSSISVCSHGVHFFFISEENGQPRYVALAIVKPTRELFETRIPCRLGDPPIDTRLKRAAERYAALASTLEKLFGVPFSPRGGIDFTDRRKADRPAIFPSQGLRLRYHGTETELRGYLDVYMTMFS